MEIDAESERHGDTENLTVSLRPRVTASVFKWIVHVCRFGLAALFLFTAGAKLWILKEFAGKVAELISSMQMNYQRWQWPMTIAVIAIEIVTAILLIVPRTVRVGAIVAGATNIALFVGLEIRTDGGGFVSGLSLSASKMTSLPGNPTRYGSIGESVGEGTRVATTVSVPSASESLIGLTVMEADAAPAGIVMEVGMSPCQRR